MLPTIQVTVLAVEPVGLTLPPCCACCGAAAAASRVETRLDGSGAVAVPYCRACHRHAAAPGTRLLAATLASGLLAGTLAAALPVLLPTLPLVTLLLLGLLGATLPVAVVVLGTRRPAAGHTASGRAAWWLPTGELACTHAGWAGAVADGAGVDGRARGARERIASGWMALGPILIAMLLPFTSWLLRPTVRVVNLTEGSLSILVDDRPVARVEPTSAESPAAGIDLYVLAGRRHLVARTADGSVVDDVQVVVQPGRTHLYAPASPESCFWLETVGYGVQAAAGLARQPLPGPVRFWTLSDVDSWFAPNPVPPPGDRRSTGGIRVALRQARCSEAPRGGAE